MKKVILLIAILASFICVFGLVGCEISNPQPEPEKPVEQKSVYLSQNEVTLTKGESITISVVSDKKLDTLSLKWKNSNQKVANYSAKGTDLTIKAVIAGEAEITLYMSGKAVDTVKVTVVDPKLSVYLPTGKLVLEKGGVATVRAKTTLVAGSDFTWTCNESFVTIESQGEIARISVSSTAPEGEYTVTLAYGQETYDFLLIVGV